MSPPLLLYRTHRLFYAGRIQCGARAVERLFVRPNSYFSKPLMSLDFVTASFLTSAGRICTHCSTRRMVFISLAGFGFYSDHTEGMGSKGTCRQKHFLAGRVGGGLLRARVVSEAFSLRHHGAQIFAPRLKETPHRWSDEALARLGVLC